ncbi:hypothetical protein C8Q74DRAFT_1373269 [Fomes fomentarius]|nr:hypothetical protein C8Q74DRAFT_1373269 [Fomes fomentarius]
MSSFSPLAKRLFRAPSGGRFIRLRSNVKPRVVAKHKHWTAAHSTEVATPETEAIEVTTKVTVDIPVEDAHWHKSDEELREPARPDAGELGTSTVAGDKRRASESDDLDDLDDICRPVKKLKTQGVVESKTKQPARQARLRRKTSRKNWD